MVVNRLKEIHDKKANILVSRNVILVSQTLEEEMDSHAVVASEQSQILREERVLSLINLKKSYRIGFL